jgi:hypothetical protein
MPIDIMKPFLDLLEKADRSTPARANGADKGQLTVVADSAH